MTTRQISASLSRGTARRAGATSADRGGRRRAARAPGCFGQAAVASRESVRWWTGRDAAERCSAMGRPVLRVVRPAYPCCGREARTPQKDTAMTTPRTSPGSRPLGRREFLTRAGAGGIVIGLGAVAAGELAAGPASAAVANRAASNAAAATAFGYTSSGGY